jgi:hypothetical protein
MTRTIALPCIRCHVNCNVTVYGLTYAGVARVASQKRGRPYICAKCRRPVTDEDQLKMEMAGMK